MTVLICTSCDAELEADGSRFCMRCGASLEGAASLPLTPMPEPEAATHEVSAFVPAPTPVLAPDPGAYPLPPQINRRAGRRPIAPPTPVPGVDALTVSRNWSSSRPLGDRKPKLPRERKMAGDLPDWEPLPPGELTVRRPQA